MSPDRLLLCARDKSDLPVPDSVPDTFPLLSVFTWLVPLLIGHLMMKADLWPTHQSQMRSRAQTYPHSSSPAELTAGSLSTRPNNPYNALFRPTLLLNRCFVTRISFFFFLPPSWRERLCIKSLTVVLTMQIPCECWSVSANSWLHTKSETEYDKGAHE